MCNVFSVANCPPGSYQNTTLMKMKDERGIDFEVSMPTCEMCPPGTYQPQEGKDECIRCDTGVSEVQGAITDEFCIPGLKGKAYIHNLIELEEV